MSDSQAVILYFVIAPILAFIAVLIVEYIVDKYKASKRQISGYKKQFKKMNEQIEKQEFLRQIKSGLSTPIDKPKKQCDYINIT